MPADLRGEWRVSLVPLCAECERRWWPLEPEHWQAYFTDDDPPELVFVCAECAEPRSSGD